MKGVVKKYIEYLKDNPRGYWFKRKIYGWGWTPATWQGWLITLIYLILVIVFAFTIDESSPVREFFFTFLLPFILLTVAFIRIAHKKGERPRWQWGFTNEGEVEK